MTVIYIIACLALVWFAWKFLNFIVGYWAIHSNPIRSGQAYIKGLLQRNSVINAGLIPDEAYKDIASLAYGMADLSYGNLRQLLFGVELKVWVRCLVWLDSWRLLLFGFFRRSILFFCLVAVVSWFERRFSDRAQR